MAFNTVKLKKYLDVINEYKAKAAFIPGMLIQLNPTGDVQKHSVQDGPAMPYWALEDELQGKGIDDVYKAGDQAQIWVGVRGEEVYALLANGESVLVGDYLTSNGDGYLKKYTPDSNLPDDAIIVAQAMENLDLSGSSGVDPSSYRLPVRVY